MLARLPSAHFSEDEFRCPRCGLCLVDGKLVAALEMLRSLAGGPVHITRGGGCRDKVYNRAVGGTSNSYHLIAKAGVLRPERLCMAADVFLGGHTVEEAVKLACAVPSFAQGGIGYYPVEGFVHVDVRPNGPARWARMHRGAPYVPWPEELWEFVKR